MNITGPAKKANETIQAEDCRFQSRGRYGYSNTSQTLRHKTYKILFHKLELVLVALLVGVTVLKRGALARMEVAVALPMAARSVPVASLSMPPVVVMVVVMMGTLLTTRGPMPAGGLLPAVSGSQTSLTALSDPGVHGIVP